MSNETHLELLTRLGVRGWNKWREENPHASPVLRRESLLALFHESAKGRAATPKSIKKGMRAKLGGIDFSAADLSSAFLEFVSLADANLANANLEGAILTDADLSGANLEGAILRDANLRRANLSGANLRNANLMYAQLNGANVKGADLTHSNVYGISAWNLKTDDETVQSDLRIENYNEPQINVSDLELAQFIYLLVNCDKLRNVLNVTTARGVLLLGRFADGGLELLQSIAEHLREEKGYLPIIFDFERLDDRTRLEVVRTLVGLVRFVIADLSGPAVPLELGTTVRDFKIPFVPIIERGRTYTSLLDDILEYPWVMEPLVFSGRADVLGQIPERISEAERRSKNRALRLKERDREAH